MEANPMENPVLLEIDARWVRYRMKQSSNPHQEIPAYVGYRRNTDWLWATNFPKYIDTMRFGEGLFQNQSEFDLSPVIKDGILNSDVAFHLIQHICFQKLRLDPSEHPLWMGLPPEIKVNLPIEGTHNYKMYENIFQNQLAYQQVKQQFIEKFQSPEIRLFDNKKNPLFKGVDGV